MAGGKRTPAQIRQSNADKRRNKQRLASQRGALQGFRRPSVPRPVLHAFAQCFVNPVGRLDAATGIPDGNANRSAPIKHRMVVSVLPNAANRIVFAIVPSALGGIAINSGIVSPVAMYKATNAAGTYPGPGWYTALINTDSSAWKNLRALDAFGLIPFADYARGDPRESIEQTSQNQSCYSADAWRVISQKATLTYTGDDFHNSGQVYVCRQYINSSGPSFVSPTVPTGFYGKGVWQISDYGASTITEISSCGDFTDTPVKKGPVSLINLHCGNFAYQPYREGFIPVVTDPDTDPISAFAQIGYNPDDGTNPEEYTNMPMPGIAEMTSTFVVIEGMQSAQPVTIDVETCVEYVVAPTSVMAKMTRMAPPRNEQALAQVMAISNHLPTSAVGQEVPRLGWLTQLRGLAGEAARDTAEWAVGSLAGRGLGKLAKMFGGLRVGNMARQMLA